MDRERIVFRRFAVGQLAVWGIFAGISYGFRFGSESESRPFVAFYGLLAVSFVLYFATLFRFWKSGEEVISWRSVLLWAALFRLPLVFASHPVQEIDYYRYLWDGRCLVAGVSPYEFAPAEVDRLRETVDPVSGPALELVGILDRSASWETIFSRIDHREVPTIYPITSQIVFAASVSLLPDSASVFARLVVWRIVLTLFDLGVVVLLFGWLRRLGAPPGRAILYGWCPLVLKEFANAAHMDVIAIFFVVAMGALFSAAAGKERSSPGGRIWMAWAAWTAAVLAKWYPLLLAPLLLSYSWARWQWKGLLPAATALLLIAAVVFVPLFLKESDSGRETEGMRTFLERWEMNDLLFSIVRENAKISAKVNDARGREDPWYSVVPDSWRRGWSNQVAAMLSEAGFDQETDIAFRTAQGVSAVIILSAATWLSLRRWPSGMAGAAEWGRRCFWLLVVAWYLSATQNPWYWCWVLPFAVFVRSRIGWAVAAFTTLYYLRFWLIYRYPEPAWLGLSGSRWFDEVVVWFEHAPILLVWLGGGFLRLAGKKRGIKTGPTSS